LGECDAYLTCIIYCNQYIFRKAPLKWSALFFYIKGEKMTTSADRKKRIDTIPKLIYYNYDQYADDTGNVYEKIRRLAKIHMARLL